MKEGKMTSMKTENREREIIVIKENYMMVQAQWWREMKLNQFFRFFYYTYAELFQIQDKSCHVKFTLSHSSDNQFKLTPLDQIFWKFIDPSFVGGSTD